MSQITAVLNGYRRGNNLNRQYGSLLLQTIKPQQVMLWYNNPGRGHLINQNMIDRTKRAVSNSNYGVWARFAYALNAKTKYICIFDDDTIPGSRWFQNCLQTIKKNRGLLGTIGLIYKTKDTYFNYQRYGWDNPNQETIKVDIVGHSWFFQRQFLTAFWRELPNPQMTLFGQDIHFSYTLQKYMGLGTYVPPHPKNDTSMWGSLRGYQLGQDRHAISLMHLTQGRPTFNRGADWYYKRCLQKGWKLVKA